MEKSMNDAFNISHVLHELFLQIRVFAPRCFNPAAALFRTCLTITLSIPVYFGQWPSGFLWLQVQNYKAAPRSNQPFILYEVNEMSRV